MVFEDFNQVAVRPQIDITFASALRTVLRQDPDIIMVGEIRDTETAEHAVQAALTGHLVLSTLHTNDAPSSITRLLDLGIPHFLITSTLIGILAQRLVRENCTHCIEEYEPTPEEAAAPAHGPGEAQELPLQARPRLPALPADRLQRPHRHLRGAAHVREAAARWSRTRPRPSTSSRRRARRGCARCARPPSRRSSAASPPPPRWCGSPASNGRHSARWRARGPGSRLPALRTTMSRPDVSRSDAMPRGREPARQGRAGHGQRPRPGRRPRPRRSRRAAGARGDQLPGRPAAGGGPGRGDPEAAAARRSSAGPTSATTARRASSSTRR